MINQSQQLAINNPSKSVGRPKAITPVVVRELVDCFRKGMNVSGACVLSGVSTSTYYKELASNKRFSDKMTIAQNETTIFANLVVKDAIEKQHDVQTSRWWIDRQDKLERSAQRAKEYRLIKRLIITKTYQETQSVKLETDMFTK